MTWIVAALSVLLIWTGLNQLGWKSYKDFYDPELPWNWRVLVYPSVYWDWYFKKHPEEVGEL